MTGKTTLAILLGSALFSSPAFSLAQSETIEKGFTEPSEHKELAFSFQGIIGKVAVKEGDTVKAGQELMKQDDRIELLRLKGLRLQADQTLLIKAKQATLDNKRVVLNRQQEMYDKQALSASELEQAKLDVVLAGAEVDLAGYDAITKGADADLQQAHVDELSMKSPVDGIVEKIIQGEGEVANIDKPSIVVVKNDPLWIDVKTLPTTVVQKFKVGDTLEVRYPGDDAWQKATINFIDPVADARAGTQAIRMEMPNPQNRSTGLTIDVRIPASSVADASH